jgi:hypothetical protein
VIKLSSIFENMNLCFSNVGSRFYALIIAVASVSTGCCWASLNAPYNNAPVNTDSIGNSAREVEAGRLWNAAA